MRGPVCGELTVCDKPQVKCFAAVLYDDQILGEVYLVNLETALYMKGMGYAIVGPDPETLIDLATWERATRPALRSSTSL